MIYAILVFTACYIVFVLLVAELPRWLRKRHARKPDAGEWWEKEAGE